ncbi:UDP-N-acetylglucosamine 2-epimerase [Hungatella hathewayi]|uniref:UDP-N-acetyl-D-glucosamine 2-epimerase, UDP-hydrolysing n=1 Tax=Hungatella hathewayi WAL-18680 TaxID=742737 RepID=G5IB31_9FIRM|nr:UDP-N-acetylglucosamine 2-epimerase [Hungatella hathewayi]EHI61346.1 UDP-N-acetyl-D-glucosamine 2-epimerase, UDP-hydrolysing [ [Hungatella hathewayi WAL-18680]
MKKICVVTATRAEYGLLRNTLDSINKDPELELCLIVTGSHLSNRYGLTVQEVLDDQFPITEQIPILADQNSEDGLIQTLSVATVKFGSMFEREKPDMLVVLGDRYELLAICQCALIYGIPICHISGGEITEGAVDDIIRNVVTKMSVLHFPGCEEYRKRIIQMGEDPQRVFNYGDVGVENITKMEYLTFEELENDLGVTLCKPLASVTFHPVTIVKGLAEKQIMELLKALDQFPDINFIITKANADIGGEIINSLIDEFVETHPNCKAFFSLGIKRYLSMLKYSQMVIGNSSSGIVEAPCFGIPTINIGDRQRGRLQADSIINCDVDSSLIVEAIKLARTSEFQRKAHNTINPYGNGNTSEMIVKEIKTYLTQNSGIKKRFYDIKEDIV